MCGVFVVSCASVVCIVICLLRVVCFAVCVERYRLYGVCCVFARCVRRFFCACGV